MFAIQLTFKFMLSSIWRNFRRFWGKGYHASELDREQIKDPIVLSWAEHKNIIILAIFAALDVGFGLWSLVYISVALYSMVKSTAMLFIMAFGIIYKLEQKVCPE